MPQDSNLTKNSNELLPSLVSKLMSKEELEKQARLQKAQEEFEKNQVEITVIPATSFGKKDMPKSRTIKISKTPCNIGYQREEFEESEEKLSITDTDFMNMPTNEVMYGSPHHIIDSMPQMMRMLVEEQSFVSFSNRLFRMVDPEIQAVSYLANRKLVKKDKQVKLIPVQNKNAVETYEYSNGGGIDEEEMDDWKNGGKSSILLSFTKDIMPDHQCDEAQLVILEATDERTIIIPEAEDFMFKTLSGSANMNIKSEETEKECILCTDKCVALEGLKLAVIKCTSNEDLVLIIGKTTTDNEENDMLTHAVARGYEDVYAMHEPQSESSGHESLEIDISSEETTEDNTSEVSFVPEGMIPDLSRLNEEIPQNKNQQIKAFHRETNGKIRIDEWRKRKKYRRFIELISLSIDSPYANRGFKSPAIRWERIIQDTESVSSLKAQERNSLFYSLHMRAKQITTNKQLYTPSEWKCTKCGFMNKHRGFDCQNKKCPMPKFANKNGFYAQIKEKNNHDRDIGKRWSEQQQKTYNKETGEWIVEPSTFHKKREAFIKKLESEGKSEKAIEHKLWHFFDRRAGKQKAMYKYTVKCKCNTIFNKIITIADLDTLKCPQCSSKRKFVNVKSEIATDRYGNQIKSKTIGDSVWRQKRNKAFQELYCTKAQWNTIYKQIEIQKKRIKLSETLTNDRKNAYNELRSLFTDCDTIQDLIEFKSTAYKQRIETNGDIIKPSLIDRISFGDERRIIVAIATRQKQIIQSLRQKK